MDTCSHLLDGVGGKDVDGFDETLGFRVAVRLRYEEVRLLCRTSRFTCKSQYNEEPSSGLEPLT